VPGLALAAYLAYGRGFVNSDAMWSLAWGRQLAHLELPDYELGATPHPLSNLLGIVLSPLGASAEGALHVVGYLAVASLVYATGLLAYRLFGLLAAVVAAGLIASRGTLLFYGALAFLDVIFAALIVWAIALEVQRPRRKGAVLVLLVIAGLLRPEAWFLGGAYALYAARGDNRARVQLLAVSAIAPVTWFVCDLAVTGNRLFSFTRTRDATAATGKPSGVAGVLEHGPSVLVQSARPAVMVAAAIGLAVARRRGNLSILLGALIATLAATAIPVAGGTPLNDRYLLPSIALVCVCASAAIALVFMPREAFLWRAAGAACIAVFAVTALDDGRRLRYTQSEVRRLTASYAAARDLVANGLPCQPLVLPNTRLRSTAAVWLEVAPEQIRDGRRRVPPGSYLWGTAQAMNGLIVISGRPGRAAPIPNGRVVEQKRGWTLRARCPN
jgi:hypothetical protein